MKKIIKILENNKGQSLVELMVAIGLAGILLPALAAGLIATSQGREQGQYRLEAEGYLQEGVEALRSIYQSGWVNIPSDGDYHPQVNGANWTLVSGNEKITNFFTRTVSISTVQRDSSGNIAPTGTSDPSTKQVVTTISWGLPLPSIISATNYYTRVMNNNTFTQTTMTDFNQGINNNTQVTNTSGGEVALITANSTTLVGNQFLVTGTTGIGKMTGTSMKTSLRFTAQNNKTVSAIRVYVHTKNGSVPTYVSGLQADSNGNPTGTYLSSGTFKPNNTGWATIALSAPINITAGTTYHLVTGYLSGTISSSKYISLRASTPLNKLYPHIGSTDSNANVLFNTGSSWAVQNKQPLYELDFNDSTFEGNPYESGTEDAVFGNNFSGELFTVGANDMKLTDVSFYIRKSTSAAPADSLQVVLMDAASGAVVEQGILTTAANATSTYAYKTYTFISARTLTSNKNYRLYLQSPNSNSKNNYMVYEITTTNSLNFDGLTYDGTNSFFTDTNNSGQRWNDTNFQSDIGGFKMTVQTSGSSNGSFESGSIDATSLGAFNYLVFNGQTPTGTTLKLQLSVNNDNSTWNYFGNDGTGTTYFNNSAAVPLSKINGRYLRYKALFTSSNGSQPVLNDVGVNFSP